MPDAWTLMKPENQPICNGIGDTSSSSLNNDGKKPVNNSQTTQPPHSNDSAEQIDKSVNLNNQIQMNLNAAPSQTLSQDKDQVADQGLSSNDTMANASSSASLGEPIDPSSSTLEDASLETSSGLNQSASSLERSALLSRLDDLKVAELRSELENRGVKVKGSVKKADLIVKLKEVLDQEAQDENASDLVISSTPVSAPSSSAPEDQSRSGLDGPQPAPGQGQEGVVSGGANSTMLNSSGSTEVSETLPPSSSAPSSDASGMSGPGSEARVAGTNGSEQKESDSAQGRSTIQLAFSMRLLVLAFIR